MTAIDSTTRHLARLNIGCVTRHPYPTAQEVRVTKFAKSLCSHGHQFFVFCPASEQQPLIETLEYEHVCRLRPRFPGSIGKILYAPLPISLLWYSWLRRQFRKYALNIVVVRDLRLALPAFLAAHACGIKAILDLGEHYPGMMEILGKQRLSHHIIRNQWIISQLESISVNKADHVWVVVEENKARLQADSSHITVISNFPDSVQCSDLFRVRPRRYSDSGEPITLISFGIIDNIRGLDLAVSAFATIVRKLPNIRLMIYGDGFFRGELEEQVRQLELDSQVVFGGWVPASDKYELMAAGDIGLILHKVCDLTNHTVPNKLFDYMSVGLPVVSTKLGPVEKILNTEQCGITVNENAQSIAEGTISLITDLDRRKSFSANGYEAVRLRYQWESEEEKIIQDIYSLTAVAS